MLLFKKNVSLALICIPYVSLRNKQNTHFHTVTVSYLLNVVQLVKTNDKFEWKRHPQVSRKTKGPDAGSYLQAVEDDEED